MESMRAIGCAQAQDVEKQQQKKEEHTAFMTALHSTTYNVILCHGNLVCEVSVVMHEEDIWSLAEHAISSNSKSTPNQISYSHIQRILGSIFW